MQLEKFADLIIADHARKDAPRGSVSWKFIEASIKAGEIQNSDEYKIAQATVSRPVGSTAPTRATRVPFTAEDDRALINWVLRHERQGASLKGNAIYEQLAEEVRNLWLGNVAPVWANEL